MREYPSDNHRMAEFAARRAFLQHAIGVLGDPPPTETPDFSLWQNRGVSVVWLKDDARAPHFDRWPTPVILLGKTWVSTGFGEPPSPTSRFQALNESLRDSLKSLSRQLTAASAAGTFDFFTVVLLTAILHFDWSLHFHPHE